jgi:AcrR family transcriptional regulator
MELKSQQPTPDTSEGRATVRERILQAAFSVFMARGFTRASMLEIATRAHVSKRELYALVGNKQAMLAAGITERAARMRPPAGVPTPRDREALAQALTAFGARVLRESVDPTVLAVFRLAIAETNSAPEVARTLHSTARESNRSALREILARARNEGLLAGDIDWMAEQFSGLLWGTLLINLLLGVVDPPTPDQLLWRAREAAATFLANYPRPASLFTIC